ncbi:MAG: TauD/TfdA family dioxygenase [Bacteroidota bacterium]
MHFFSEIPYSSSSDFQNQFLETLKTYKLVLLSNVPEDIDRDEFYKALARHCGQFHQKSEDDNTAKLIADKWLDISYNAKKGHTFRHSNTRQPLHIDGSYTDLKFDVIFFYCKEQAEIGGATTFIDGPSVVDYLEKFDANLYSDLIKHDVAFEKGNNNYKIAKIIDIDSGKPKFNWNYYRVSKSNKPYIIEMSEKFHQFCEERLVDGGLLKPIRLKPGEAIFFHDKLVLHGRNSFWGNRCLMKGAILL